MSKADEMFEELGYNKVKDDDSETIYQFKDRLLGDLTEHNIMFVKVSRIVFSYNTNIKKCCGLDMQDLKAINKKCEELGWNE